ncbi:MAG TPA: aminotransferase class V-fold PLP-dependent enzyme, partial [Polyangiaceae bacterium]|nr:aminotransferase class V-fold PLP-dependent enzyme [Polyangiaceae bacterium]
MLSAASRAARAPGVDFGALRRREFGRLDASGVAYLDYAASALYGASQLRAHFEQLEGGLFGNPHSDSAPSRASIDALARARREVLRFFDVDESTHEVCFTANTSAAVKLVAEGYPFGPRRGFVLSADNHNSVLGVREYARRAGAPVTPLPLDADLRLSDPEARLAGARAKARDGGLFAFPAQSNFSGVCHPLSLVRRARSLGFDVLVDVAAFAPSHPLSLRRCPADFAALSFYKLFGYPTGLGALVARREALARLRRPWFAGGTVRYASVAAGTHRLHEGHEGFEDGTPDFLGLAALGPGFRLLDEVGMGELGAHVARLTARLLDGLSALRHRGGAPLVRLYGPRDRARRGGTVAFNVCDRAGRLVPYPSVESLATRANIALRGGCFCNPGAAEAALGLDPKRVGACLRDLGEGFSVGRFASCLGGAVGALRASLGLANDERDVDRALELVA